MNRADAALQRLTPAEVQALAEAHGTQAHCATCASVLAPGWTSWPSGVPESTVEPLGALWLAGDDEPTLEELRPVGMDSWSPDMPISLKHYPANRCEIWACVHCHKPFLRYTEYGGYYVDKRVRELDPRRLVTEPNPET